MQEVMTINRVVDPTPEAMRFRVSRPSVVGWVGAAVISVLLVALPYALVGRLQVFLLAELVVVVLLAPPLWGRLVLPLCRKVVVLQDVGRSVTGRGVGLLLGLLGLKFRDRHEYYLETQAGELPAGNVLDVMRLRLLDSVFTSLGIGLVLYSAAGYILSLSDLVPGLGLVVLIAAVAPLFASLLVPVLWVLEDSQIREIDSDGHVVGDGFARQIRSGRLSRVLGYSSIFLTFTYLMLLLGQLGVSSYGDRLVLAGLYLLVLSLLVAGVSYLVSLLYLSRYHEEVVNEIRDILHGKFPYASTHVVKSDPTVFCKSCGVKNSTLSKFCSECGHPLVDLRCGDCGTPYTRGKRFCSSCGGSLR